MAYRVVLHVGAMKTGTSYLQSVLEASPQALAAADAGWPVPFGQQVDAVNDVLNIGRQPGAGTSRWHEVAERVRLCDQRTAVLSMEFLSFARPRQVGAFLEPFHGLDVTVLLTVRDQVAVLPAQWQTYTRNYGSEAWPAYLAAVRAEGPERARAHRTFHRAQGLRRIVDTWSVPGVAVAVATVPAPGAPREELWHRFAAAAGLGAAAAVTVADPPTDNQSLGYASCDALRRVNAHLGDLPRLPYRRVMRPVARRVLGPRRPGEARPVPDGAAVRWAVGRNAAFRELVRGRRVAVHGDLADLPVSVPAGVPGEVAPPHPGEVRAALEAIRSFAARSAAERPRTGALDLEALAADAAKLVRSAAANP